jgi:hypothetical protein
MVEQMYIHETERRAFEDQKEGYRLPKKRLDCKCDDCRPTVVRLSS